MRPSVTEAEPDALVCEFSRSPKDLKVEGWFAGGRRVLECLEQLLSDGRCTLSISDVSAKPKASARRTT